MKEGRESRNEKNSALQTAERKEALRARGLRHGGLTPLPAVAQHSLPPSPQSFGLSSRRVVLVWVGVGDLARLWGQYGLDWGSGIWVPPVQKKKPQGVAASETEFCCAALRAWGAKNGDAMGHCGSTVGLWGGGVEWVVDVGGGG